MLEDLHWATDSTLQLLHYLARAIVAQPLLIVGTLRPEAVPPAHPLATLGRRLERDGLARRLHLPRLSAAAVASLIGQLSGDGEVAKPLAERLYRETEGNPFYLTETTQGAVRGRRHPARSRGLAGRLRGPGPGPAAAAGQRKRDDRGAGGALERGGPGRRAGGRGGRPGVRLQPAEGGVGQGGGGDPGGPGRPAAPPVDRRGWPAGADYAFTHHKIQEVIYEGLPRHRRLYLHGQVGLAMERWLDAEPGPGLWSWPGTSSRPGSWTQRLTDKAIAYLLQAGRQAERQSANQEALSYYQRGLDILHSLPETPQRLQQEIELQIALTVPTTVVHGYASSETRDVYDRASELCPQARRHACAVHRPRGAVTVLRRVGRYQDGDGSSRNRSSPSPRQPKRPRCCWKPVEPWAAPCLPWAG